MFGFIVGTICLIALVKVLRAHHAWGHGCGYRRYSRWGGFQEGRGPYGGGFGRHFGRRWALRWLFERLETMPGQERTILQALDRLSDNRALVHGEMKQTRADLARAIEMGLIDDGTLEETFARHDRLLAQLRVSIVEALKTATETLDERQRKELAAILGRGGWAEGPWSGPYRTWA
jgi:hypothetical protein